MTWRRGGSRSTTCLRVCHLRRTAKGKRAPDAGCRRAKCLVSLRTDSRTERDHVLPHGVCHQLLRVARDLARGFRFVILQVEVPFYRVSREWFFEGVVGVGEFPGPAVRGRRKDRGEGGDGEGG